MASSYNDEFIISWLCKHVNSTGICRCCRAGKNLSSKLAILVLGFVFVILTYLLSHRTAGHSSARQVKFIPFQEALLWKHRNHMKSYGSMSEFRFYYVFSRYVSLSYMLYAAFMLMFFLFISLFVVDSLIVFYALKVGRGLVHLARPQHGLLDCQETMFFKMML